MEEDLFKELVKIIQSGLRNSKDIINALGIHEQQLYYEIIDIDKFSRVENIVKYGLAKM